MPVMRSSFVFLSDKNLFDKFYYSAHTLAGILDVESCALPMDCPGGAVMQGGGPQKMDHF